MESIWCGVLFVGQISAYVGSFILSSLILRLQMEQKFQIVCNYKAMCFN